MNADAALPQKGTRFTRSFTVTEAVHAGFIQLFNDRHPYHTDDTAARSRGFRGKIMHGNILSGFLSFFVGECLPIKTVVIQSQEINFHRPFYLHDALTLHAEVIDVYESVRTIEFRFFFENQDKLKIAKGRLNIGYL